MEDKKEKTPEQLKAERLKRYQESPDSFIEMSEIICAAIKSNKSSMGVAVMVNGYCKRSEINNAQCEINHSIEKMRIQMEVAREMNKAAMTPHPGAMHKFANKVMGR